MQVTYTAFNAFFHAALCMPTSKIINMVATTVPAIQKSIGALDDDFKGSLWQNTGLEIRIVRAFTAFIFYAPIICSDVVRVICTLCLRVLL